MSTATTLVTRQPTGRPSWPIVLLAGREKSGKSWACAVASGSDLIGRTLWIGAGEDDPDEYALIPGARFEIVVHDGTYRGILAAIEAAAEQPPVDGRPNLLVLDSATRLWDLLCDMAQAEANRRAAEKARKQNRSAPADDVQITMDLWNIAKDRWQHVVDALRGHQGPSLVTARLEEVTVMDGRGQPTAEKTLKIKAEKSLPFDVAAVVQMPERGRAVLTGVRSAVLKLAKPTEIRDFTVDRLWRDMGLAEAEVDERRHTPVRREHLAPVPDERPAGGQRPRPPAQRQGRDRSASAGGNVKALDEAKHTARWATRCSDVAELRARWMATSDLLMAYDVAEVVSDDELDQVLQVMTKKEITESGMAPGAPLRLRHWLAACGWHVERQGGLSVAEAVALANEPAGVHGDPSPEEVGDR